MYFIVFTDSPILYFLNKYILHLPDVASNIDRMILKLSSVKVLG